MADISEVKVSGVTYNIKDGYSRNSNYMNIISNWDGNTENLESIQLGDLTYYRVTDSISTNNYLIGDCSNLNFYSILNSNKIEAFMLMKLMWSLVEDSNWMLSSISLNNKLYELYRGMFEQEAPELLNEIDTLCQKHNFGMWLQMNAFMFLNVTEAFTMSAELSQFFIGDNNEHTISEGLWITKINMGEEMGHKEFWVFPDLIYEISPSLTDYIDAKLNATIYIMNKMDGSSQSVTTTQTGLSSVGTYSRSGDSYTSTSSFVKDQTVYIKCTMPSDSYEITEITAIGNNSETIYSLEETSGDINSTNIKWYRFYMPEEQVNITITCTTTTE